MGGAKDQGYVMDPTSVQLSIPDIFLIYGLITRGGWKIIFWKKCKLIILIEQLELLYFKNTPATSIYIGSF